MRIWLFLENHVQEKNVFFLFVFCSYQWVAHNLRKSNETEQQISHQKSLSTSDVSL